MKQTEHEGQMTVFKQEKADECNILEDESLRKTINTIFDKPVETLDMLQSRLLAKPGAKRSSSFVFEASVNDSHIAHSLPSNVAYSTKSSTSQFGIVTSNSSFTSKKAGTMLSIETHDSTLYDYPDIEELTLEADTNSNLTECFTDNRKISLAKVDNFICDEDEGGVSPEEEDFLRLTPAFCSDAKEISLKQVKNTVSEVNTESINKPDRNVLEPEFDLNSPFKVMILNTVSPYDPFPGEAVDIMDELVGEMSTEKSRILPVLSEKNLNVDTLLVEKSDDRVMPFTLDNDFDYDNYTHVPKFGQEVRILIDKHL